MSAGAAASRPPRIRVPAAPLAALVLLVLGTLTLAPAVSANLAQQRRIAAAEAHVAAQERDLTELTAQRARWSDPAYVRAQAGSRLFYVLPGTTAYRLIHASAGRAIPAPPAATARPAHPAWTAVLLDSLVDAGSTTGTPAQLDSGR